MKEPIYTYLRRRLEETVGQHSKIARETGVPQGTISRIHVGGCDPRIGTVQPLLDWFERHDRIQAAVRRVMNRKQHDAPQKRAEQKEQTDLPA